MDESVIQHAQTYASCRKLQLNERLGFGIHGIIFATKNNTNSGDSAIKAHRYAEPYHRERDIYLRLKEAGIGKIRGFNVPQLLGFDDELLVVQMSIVKRPFVLDFAGAYLDAPPDFPDEKWNEWETEKRDQFESRWPEVQAVLAALEEYDIYMVDVSPSNISFAD